MRNLTCIVSFWMLFCIESIGQKLAKAPSTNKKIIITNLAPKPVGPYSQGVVANGLLFVAGQLGTNPETRQLVTDSFEAEVKQTLDNIGAILQPAGINYQQVVKTTIYIKDMAQFAKVNEIYSKYFVAEPPAWETVEVSALAGNANIEISVIAVMK